MTRRHTLFMTLLLLSSLTLGVDLDRPASSGEQLSHHIELLRSRAREQLHATFGHIVAVHYRLKVGGAGLCGESTAPVLGAAVARGSDFLVNPWLAARLGGKWDDVEEAVGAGDRVMVFAVVEGSPADRAGLAVGDLVVALDGGDIDLATDVFDRLRRSKEGSLLLEVQRGNARINLDLPRVEGCDHGAHVFISTGADTRPHENRHDIAVPTGLARFSRDDDEIAIALAHQMAHQLLGTTYPKRGKDEPPADRLGLFLAARAGFDVSKAPAFWDRLAAGEPWKVNARTTLGAQGFRLWHTAMALRAPVIRSTVSEIATLVAAEAPLDP